MPRNGPAGVASAPASRRRGGRGGRTLVERPPRAADGLIALPLSRLTLSGTPSRQSCRSALARAARPRRDRPKPPSRPSDPFILAKRTIRPRTAESRDQAFRRRMKLIPARAGPKQKGGTLSVLEERARFQETGSAPLPLGTLTKPRSY